MDDLREQLKELLYDLPKLFGKLEELLLASSAVLGDVHQLKARWQDAVRDRDLNQVSHDEYDRTLSQIRKALVNLIDRLQPGDLKNPPKGTITAALGLGEYHIYTCDRVDQADHFNKIFSQKRDCKAHFFYLYGMDLQSHLGIFRRIAYDLEGALVKRREQETDAPTCRSEQIELTFDESRDLEVYKQNVLKELFGELGMRLNEQEPLAEKNLAWLSRHAPRLSSFGGRDYVCVFVSIDEEFWLKDITPAMTRWFVNEFCACDLPSDSPTFLFFFAVSYEEDDSPVEEEVREVLAESELVENETLTVLPELGMVERTDVSAWFKKYNFIATGKRELKELRQSILKEIAAPYYMEDVEVELKKIIDAFNTKFNR